MCALGGERIDSLLHRVALQFGETRYLKTFLKENGRASSLFLLGLQLDALGVQIDILTALTKETYPLALACIACPDSAITKASSPVPTRGRSGRSNGTACRCMFEPIRARLASSCSKNGIREVATEII